MRAVPFWRYASCHHRGPRRGLGGVRALTCRSELRDDDLVHQSDVRGRVEDLGGEIDGAVGLATAALTSRVSLVAVSVMPKHHPSLRS